MAHIICAFFTNVKKLLLVKSIFITPLERRVVPAKVIASVATVELTVGIRTILNHNLTVDLLRDPTSRWTRILRDSQALVLTLGLGHLDRPTQVGLLSYLWETSWALQDH